MFKKGDWIISLKICKESIRKWKNDPRIWSAMLLVCLFEWTKIQPIRQVCIEQDLSVSNWYFPFLFSENMNTLFFFFGILLLFCDAPFIDNQQMFVVLRSGKRNWFRGKVIYLFIASCIYFLWMYFVSLIEFLPYVGFSTKWEEILIGLSVDGRVGIRLVTIPGAVVLQFSPIQAWVMSYVICVLLSFFLGLLIFYLNLFQKQNIGVGVALVIILITGVIEILPTKYLWKMRYFSPISWADIEIFTLDYGGVPFWYAITFLCVAIVLLIILIMQKAKSYNMEAMEEL